ncbi:major facilitator superfamily MFS_1 [Cellulomonas flavigena DSM 20109]|uniref:Major facilitator superfamily MFS_1 n=1 Tax=Cellulomonas flavigena (strain ATCC 482 / DSM 20109 / BCRC 11376 / JCM 18109 / NBRC 3775 / NCIMB 8073 / NRS 134) TaxID=446466 RepID=D5UJR8_CELFN|nr:MFS transporter [Cellulomonas flavigena]ADG75706.1 major facilitator superfamily MFS_1 [Cellulomonas flavigena DSM 20109]
MTDPRTPVDDAAVDTPADAPPAAPAMTHREVLEALSGILLGMFVSILATSVVSTSLPRIITDLGGSQSAFTWVVTATLLTTTVSTPVWGKLADLVDRKLLVQLALAISVVSSALAGLAHSTEMLIGMRALQGVGAGGLTALGTVLLADIISPRDRGRYMGLMGAVMAVGMVGGPLLGGVITDAAGWRWNFFVGLPFAVAAIVVLQRTLHLPGLAGRRVRIDWTGTALLSASVATLLLWVTFAGSSFAWLSWQTAAMVGGAALGVIALVLVEQRASEPIIPLHLFRNRTVVLTVVASVAVGIALFGTQVFLSQYMQLARGTTPTESGLLTVPMVVGTFLASTVSGRAISRTGRYKAVMVVGAVLLTAGLALMGSIDETTSFTLVGLYMLVVGSGVGMLMQNLVLATQNTLPVTDMGAGTATVAFFRTLGGAIGVSALGAVLAHRVQHLMVDGLTELGVPASALGSGGVGALPDLATLPGPVRSVVEHAFGVGVAELFLIGAPVALLALVAVLALREVPLGRASGVEQRLAQAASQAGTPTAAARG